MKEIDFEKLTGKQKAAILMIAMGVESASNLARHLNEREIEEVTREMARLDDVPSTVVDQVISEFGEMVQAQEYVAQGGIDYAQRILAEAFGPKRGTDLIHRIEKSMHVGGFTLLRGADANQILNLIQNEHPQTIALILSYLDASQAAQVVLRLQEDLQKEVVYRMATMEKVPSELLTEVERSLQAQFDDSAETSAAMDEMGGADVVAEILNMTGKTVEKTILEEIEVRNPELADHIRDLMFTFDDLTHLDDRSVQRVLKEVDTRQMALALKGAGEELKQKIFSNMSERAGGILREEMEYMGPVRVRDVEEAQRQIASLVRSLEEDGQIIIARKGAGSEEVLV